jgi:hypothetical protein
MLCGIFGRPEMTSAIIIKIGMLGKYSIQLMLILKSLIIFCTRTDNIEMAITIIQPMLLPLHNPSLLFSGSACPSCYMASEFIQMLLSLLIKLT